MPEGHTIHRLARDQKARFGGQVVRASSPQGRFEAGAERIDGLELRATEAWGKHLLHHYVPAGSGLRRIGVGPILHVHLGLYGKFATGAGLPPAPRGALRLRLEAQTGWTDLRGPTACELIEPDERTALFARLGPDPLRTDADPAAAWRRISRSRTAIAALLMDQKVIAGIGNVYRAELLFRHRVDPFRAGRDLAEATFTAMWTDLVTLMRAGVTARRIVTIRPEDRPRRGRLTRAEAVYVYRHAGEPCRICGTEVLTQQVVGRNLFWCPYCQHP